MSESGPKLYTNKPKKSQLKQFQEGNPKLKNVSAPPVKAATPAPPSSESYKMGGGSTPPPPKESFARRYKFMWPLLLAVNFTVGAYLFTRTTKKKEDTDHHGTLTENEQREVFKWVLEEKRKMNPKDEEEKKRIEEEKAVLKHFIRVKSIPPL